MFEEISTAIDIYQAKWQKLVEARKDKAFFQNLRPTAVGWKTQDFAELQRRSHELATACDQIHSGWLNERWLVTMHLREQKLGLGIELVKLMQRRPESKDAVGLDHLDFLIPQGIDIKTVLAQEPGLKWTEEKNGDFCQWISVWFEGTEAKLRMDTTFDVGAAELVAVSNKIKASSGA